MQTRRLFIRDCFSGLAVLMGGAVFLESCGSNNSPYVASQPNPVHGGGNCAENGTSVSIQVVHTPNHTLTIPKEDVAAGVDRTYTLADNGSGHTHEVTITAADFANLQMATGIGETSTLTIGHTHLVTVNCA